MNTKDAYFDDSELMYNIDSQPPPPANKLKKCRKGIHEYVDRSKETGNLLGTKVVFKVDRKCRWCGKEV